jgi:hypothetical protein
MFNDEGELDIFENFLIDRDLPKHRPPEDADPNEQRMMSFSSARLVTTAASAGSFVIGTGQMGQLPDPMARFTWVQRLAIWLLNKVSPDPVVVRPLTDPPPPPPTMTILEFFRSMKNTAEELVKVDERVRGYEAAIDRAKRTGQTAMLEQLKAGLGAARSETQLHAIGVTKVVREDTLVEFVKKCPKGLRLDWMKNFTRVVPDEVLEAKERCDECLIFDNYVVLHYDPHRKSWAETQAEKNRRKDPILFGVLQGSRKLYFVGDWIDEFCDLTLDGIADVLGNDAIEELDMEDFGE